MYYVHILVSIYVKTICNRKHNTLFKAISINILKLTKKHKKLYSTELNTSKHEAYCNYSCSAHDKMFSSLSIQRTDKFLQLSKHIEAYMVVLRMCKYLLEPVNQLLYSVKHAI